MARTPLHPYAEQPPRAFWRPAVAEARVPLAELYRPRWPIAATDPIATAGSCFAQHIGRALRARGLNLVDREPPPPALPAERHAAFGFGLYSARYGNIYTARQLRQLVEQAFGARDPAPVVWCRGDRSFDALRPTVEPEGLDSPAEVAAHRAWHLDRVREVFTEADVFVFTLGLTEGWIDRQTGTAFPTAPGVVAGRFEPERIRLHRATVAEVCADIEATRALVARHRGRPLRTVLTVSPVPLTATATDAHVLVATMASKATLRAAADELCAGDADVDYFPSYEIIANPWSGEDFYRPDRRTVAAEGVERATGLFCAAHGFGDPEVPEAPAPAGEAPPDTRPAEDVICEEALLEAFAR